MNSNTIKLLIIEDEEPARALLKHYLRDHDEIEIVGECPDGFCGLKEIKEKSPDLILLDIQMPRLTGFELLELLDNKPEIIFTTAYDEYAIRAFEMNAVDYLLKPFSQERFNHAIKRALERVSEGASLNKNIEKMSREGAEGQPTISRIVVKKGSSIRFIPVNDISRIEAEDDYVMIYHSEGKALKQQTMKYYETGLPPENFARIHRSAIVRIDNIERIEPYGKETYRAVLKDGARLPVSRSGYKLLKEKISF